jgi:2-polyprenyl-6-methoxyphenol hydroxylase-like FAD-dependent oxidoreductase
MAITSPQIGVTLIFVSLQDSFDVIVAGAGPVGLFLAAEVRRFGVSVVVIERLAEPSQQIKAGSVGPQSAELFDQRGLLDQFPQPDPGIFGKAARGSAAPARGHFAGLWVLRGAPEIRTPPIFAPQQQVELVLERHARDAGATILREHEVVALDDAAPNGETPAGAGTTGGGGTMSGSVRVAVACGAGPVKLTARYLVGCDGGRSSVRRLAGFDFPGTDATITGRQALVTIAEPNPLPRGWQRTDRGMVVFGPDPRRVLTVEFDGPPADRAAPLTADEVQASLRRVSGTDVTVTALHTGTRWTDNARQPTTYRRGRILLAGDAAHIHPPFGGQGLNLGLQDAANLGWKLAAVIAGSGSPALLDTYTAERHPAGAVALENTRAQVALMRPDPQTSAMRAIFAELLDYDDANQHLSRLMTGLDRPYPAAGRHPEAGQVVADRPVETAAGHRRLYELLRMPGGLLIDGSPDSGWSKVAAGVGQIHAVPGPPSTDSLLIRPDGIVAWGATADIPPDEPALAAELSAALELWFGEPARQ